MEKPDPYGEWVLHNSKRQRALFHVQSTNCSWLLRAQLGPTYWPMRSDNLPRKTQRQKQKLSQQNGIKDEKALRCCGLMIGEQGQISH
jgi:hypothetical protein